MTKRPSPTSTEKEKWSFQCRHVLAAMSFMGLWHAYTMRVNLSVAIVAMVNASAQKEANQTIPDSCPIEISNTTSKKFMREGHFEWNEYWQGIVLGAFSYGLVCTNIIGGRAAELAGVKWTFGLGLFAASLMTLLTPLVAQWNFTAFIAVRVIAGLGEGVLYPAMLCMIARWYVKEERGFYVSFIHAGSRIGTVIGIPLTSLLCQLSFLDGWPLAFYVFGGLSLIWCIFWFLLMYEHPVDHPRISENELNYITERMKEEGGHSEEKVQLPWISLLTSLPVWACIVSSFASDWGFNTLMSDMPSFLKSILHYDLTENGLLSALPYVLESIFGILAGFLSDWMLTNNICNISTTWNRRLFNSLGTLLPCMCLIGVTLAGCSRPAIVALLSSAVGLSGAMIPGFYLSMVDMSPVFAGTIKGLSNSISEMAGFLAPYVVGVLTDKNQTLGQWHIVFYIGAAIYAFAAVVFVVIGTGERQAWNNSKETKRTRPVQGSSKL